MNKVRTIRTRVEWEDKYFEVWDVLILDHIQLNLENLFMSKGRGGWSLRETAFEACDQLFCARREALQGDEGHP